MNVQKILVSMEYQFNIKITISPTWVDVKEGNIWRKIYRVIIIFIDIMNQ